MSINKTQPRKAWIIVADKIRNQNMAEASMKFKPNQPLAVFPPQWGVDKLLPIIDAFVQFISNSPTDMIDYARPNQAPYLAQKEAWGQEGMGGYDPNVYAIHVDDLVVCTDAETGESWFEYTRKPSTRPRHLSE